jgi:uncharacterized membrane protein YcaP (DUF421 family)
LVLVVVVIISESIQQAMLGGDNSMTNALLIVLTLVGMDVAFSIVGLRAPVVDKLLNGVPLILVSDGEILKDRLRKTRVSEDDILEQARRQWGVGTLDDVRYAVLERSGSLSIVPRRVPWLERPATAEASAGA